MLKYKCNLLIIHENILYVLKDMYIRNKEKKEGGGEKKKRREV